MADKKGQQLLTFFLPKIPKVIFAIQLTETGFEYAKSVSAWLCDVPDCLSCISDSTQP
ncbi:MAG: hypothetical protein J0M22_16485 [Gammaproteobacteria bacterium]|nr:hypothetical protein [Gammaproteobacteria bacterium]